MNQGITLQTFEGETQIFSCSTDSVSQGYSMQIKENEIFVGEFKQGEWIGRCKFQKGESFVVYSEIKNGIFLEIQLLRQTTKP